MDKKRLIIISSVAGVLLLIAVSAAVYWFVIRDDGNAEDTNTNQTNQPTNNINDGSPAGANGNTNVPADNTNTGQPSDTPEQSDEKSILRISRLFVERYGSYSNRNNFENITRLEPFMTEEFKTESAEYIDSKQSEETADEFYSIATTAVTVTMTNYKAKTSATVTVSTRRIEKTSDKDPRTFNQDAVVQFKYVSGYWKVDNLTWK